jgi:hypothetical protein
VFYVAVAIGFGIAFAVQAVGEYGAQYFAGYRYAAISQVHPRGIVPVDVSAADVATSRVY